MIFKKIKEHFIAHRYASKVLEEQQYRAPSSKKKIASVAILTHDDFFYRSDLQELVNSELDLRNSRIYSFRDFEKAAEVSYKHFSESDFNWKGEITDTSLQSFLEEPFDLLINYYDAPHCYLEYATALSQATFKVGFSNVNGKLFDLEVQEKASNVTAFLQETKKYLLALNKLDA